MLLLQLLSCTDTALKNYSCEIFNLATTRIIAISHCLNNGEPLCIERYSSPAFHLF